MSHRIPAYKGAKLNYGGHVNADAFPDRRVELGNRLEPYARFDADIEKFCCRGCGYQTVTYRGIDAHLADCSTAKPVQAVATQ